MKRFALALSLVMPIALAAQQPAQPMTDPITSPFKQSGTRYARLLMQAFDSIPASKLDTVVDGLQSTHKNGIRYPIPTFMNYTAKFPPKYEAVWDVWGEKKPSER